MWSIVQVMNPCSRQTCLLYETPDNVIKLLFARDEAEGRNVSASQRPMVQALLSSIKSKHAHVMKLNQLGAKPIKASLCLTYRSGKVATACRSL